MSENNAQLDRIDRYARLIEQQCGKAVRPYRQDGYVNLLNRYGTQKDTSERYNYQAEPTIPDDQLTTFYEGNGLFAKIIDTPAEEAIKHGFKLQNVADQKIEDFFTEALDELDWEETAMTAVKWARLFGGSIAVMLINDGCESLDMPLDWKNIRSIDDIRVFDRSLIQPDYQSMFNYDPKNPFATRGSRLGMPEFFDVTSKYGNFRVHESRCLVFQNGILPENTTNSVYQMWGMPEYVRLHRAIRDAELSHGNAAKMLDRSIQAVYKMQGLSNLLQTEQGEGQVLRRLQTIDMARGLLNSITIDADGEDYDFRTFQLNGVSEVVNASCNFLSALSNIPQTLLFGRSPAGMNATGDGDMENYYNFCERIQKRMIRPNLRYLLSVIFQAGMATGEIDEIPKIKVDFNPLWSLSELEEANLEQTKANTQKIKADTANIYVNMQAVDPSEVRKKLADSDEFDIEDVLDEYSDEELFPPEPEVPVDENGNPIQPAETDQLVQGVNLNAHNGQPDDTGTAPAAAPAATKLPEDFSAQEAEMASSIAEQAEDTPIINQDENSGSVGVLVISEGKILSATRHNDFGYGLICGPGGHIEPGESAEEAAIRETQEEFGIKPVNLIPLGQGPTEPDTGLTPELFLCTEFEGEVSSPDLEMAAPKFRSMEELSELAAAMFQPFADGLQILMECIGEVKNDGGPGSGNWGHEGRPGQIGGSKDGGGSHNRLKDKSGSYTSFSKERKKFATPHKISKDEVKKLKPGTVIVTSDGKWVQEEDYGLVNMDHGAWYSPQQFLKEFGKEDVRILIPDSENKNFQKEKIRTNDQFSESRKKAAFSTSDRKEADAMFRENTGKVWRELPENARAALNAYTGSGFMDINRGLRTGDFYDTKTEERANLIANAIEKCSLPTDAYLHRGTSISALAKLVGNPSLDSIHDFDKYVGAVVKDNAFLSCGTAESTGYDHKTVQLKIYCPKGTKGIYAEPFSQWGEGDQEAWDGKSSQKYFSSEFETILQRGTSLQITGVNKNEDGKLEVECQVVSQDPVINSTPPKKDEDDFVHDGGPGSGNHGHKGRPGQVGGSSDSGHVQAAPIAKHLEDYELRNIRSPHRSVTGGWGLKRQCKNFLRSKGISDNVLDDIDRLIDGHKNGGDWQIESDAKIVKHMAEGDAIGKALIARSQFETGCYEEWKKHHPDSTQLNENGELRVYRKGGRKSGVEAWTIDPEGADMGYGGIGFDHESTLEQLQREGYSVIAGFGTMGGSSGEGEITFVKTGDGESKKAKAPSVADRSAKDFTPKQSAYASDEFKAISKQITDARTKSDDAYKRVKVLKQQLLSETTFKPRYEWTEEDELDDLLGNRPRKYTAEGERIKVELDKAIQAQVAAIDEKDAALEAAYQFKERIRAEQVKDFHPGSPKPATKDDYDGFTLAKTSNGMADDYLASGDAYIAEMSPKEYIERCAFEIFESGTLESTMGAVSEDTARKYAKQMSDGVKFDLPYLDYSGQGQEGRHRAVAAYLAGIDTMPVLIIGEPPHTDCADDTALDGGKGSGNWGHEGRPGKIGGSAEGGGTHNRLGDKQKGYTSFSKEKKKFATPHKPEKHEFSRLPNEAVVITPYGNWQHYKTAGYYMCKDTGEVIWDKDMYDGLADEEIRVIIPDSENRNYRKFKLSDAEQFSEERKKAAFSTKSPAEADAKFRENTGKVWRNLDDDSRYALYVYTTNSYRSINTSLRTGQSAGKHYDGYIEKITAAIDQCELPCDAYLFRGSSTSALGKLLGNPHLSNTDDLDRYVGRVVKDKAFLSTGTAEGTGMDDNVSYRIYCPKGTKAIYAEPFSSFNKYGDKNKWNGIDGQSGFSYEDETILQRGTSLQILSVTRDGKWGIHVEAQVVSQDHD